MKPVSTTARLTSSASLSVALVAVLCALVAAYTYCVAASVLDVVLRNDADKRAASLRSQIAAFESELIIAQHTVSARVALSAQFESDAEKIFVSRDGTDSVALRPTEDE